MTCPFSDFWKLFRFSETFQIFGNFSHFFGHVMSSHHSEQMSQRSQVSRMASWIAFCMSISKVLSVSLTNSQLVSDKVTY